MLSNEYDIRACVIRELLADGWKSEDIRIEIPMSTGSSGGRADIVLLNEGWTAAIELKSGKDKFCDRAIDSQMQKYRQSFDYCKSIIDAEHRVKTTVHKKGGTYISDNFRSVDLVYRHTWDGGKLVDLYDNAIDGKITAALFGRWGRGYATVYDMACVLWADELRTIMGNRAPKNANERQANEIYGAADFRQLYIAALRARPQSDWEKKFWEKFYTPDTRTDLEKMQDSLMRRIQK